MMERAVQAGGLPPPCHVTILAISAAKHQDSKEAGQSSEFSIERIDQCVGQQG